jgi:hypothetical protein
MELDENSRITFSLELTLTRVPNPVRVGASAPKKRSIEALESHSIQEGSIADGVWKCGVGERNSQESGIVDIVG